MATDAEEGLLLLKALVSPHASTDRDGPTPWRPCPACRAAKVALTPQGQHVLKALIATLPPVAREAVP